MNVDYRCALSGVSLMSSETMGVLLAAPIGVSSPRFEPCALPLWGRYEGTGTLVDMSEGPNAHLITRLFNIDLSEGDATIEWEELGIEAVEIDHIETLVALIRMNAIHELRAISWRGYQLDLALFESNVAAAYMQREPARLHSVPLDELPSAVLLDHPIARRLFAETASLGPTLRCKFGLSLVGLAALSDAVRGQGGFRGAGKGSREEPNDKARWLVEAYRDCGDNEELQEALNEYASTLLGEVDDDLVD